LFLSGYPPPTGLDHQKEAALLVPIAHRSKLTESRLPQAIVYCCRDLDWDKAAVVMKIEQEP
jgi:hypothetical protein